MRVAAAQTAPSWGDSEATTAIVVEWIAKAADQDVDLVAFGETFLPGYLFWLSRTDATKWDDPSQKAMYAHYLASSIRIDGPEITAIAARVSETGVFTYVGIVERAESEGAVFATYVGVDPTQGVVSAHRKLTPTYDERMIWAPGDGHGLRVHDVGEFKVSALNCWENWGPAIRHTLYAQGTQLHVAGWPGSRGLTDDITRFIAKEGRCYVLSAAQLLSPEAIPDGTPLREEAIGDESGYFYPGGSAIAAPDGNWLAKPVYEEETLVTADIDVNMVRGERENFDPAGHYFRSDVINVSVDRTRRRPARFTE